jgi:DNA modification methylase
MKRIDTNLIHGECLEEMAKLPDGCVDMVLCRPAIRDNRLQVG